MNKNSSGFTFIFSSVMVIVVAVLLASAAIVLGPYQAKNIRLEKMQNILSSIGIQTNREEAEKLFNQYIKEQLLLNSKGAPVTEKISAFDIDLKKELDKARLGKANEQLFPLFVFDKDGKLYYIIPVRGKGLWGPIWGYVALEGDLNTIHGASFGHKAETPGLGAEIETAEFQRQFKGKKIFDDAGNFVSVHLIKGGAAPGDLHGVDAVSGGTITSTGVSEMLQRTISSYLPYFKTINKTGSNDTAAKDTSER
ncbi:MAG: NADH:ubiquinone reductase (Na(+)-transporting) subunit C [Chitinophagaceae bacterium]